MISIIIPFRDNDAILKRCISSILNRTKNKSYEIILVNNRSTRVETRKYLAQLEKNKKINILSYNRTFNFSAINNYAVRYAKGEFILFLNNDTEVINGNWLDEMLKNCIKHNVGAVGAKLLYPDKTIQHAGIMLNENIAIHVFSHLRDEDFARLKEYNRVRNWSAVTGACMMTKKEIFLKVRGFDEKNLPIAYNDVDYCLKLISRGYKVVWTPNARLYHDEAATRGSDILARLLNPKRYQQFLLEQGYMRKKWGHIINNDPYFEPGLS